MKKIATLVFALLLAGSLSFAQAGGDKKASDTSTSGDKSADSGKKDEKGKKGKKGKKGDKSKKGSGDTATTPPPK